MSGYFVQENHRIPAGSGLRHDVSLNQTASIAVMAKVNVPVRPASASARQLRVAQLVTCRADLFVAHGVTAHGTVAVNLPPPERALAMYEAGTR